MSKTKPLFDNPRRKPEKTIDGYTKRDFVSSDEIEIKNVMTNYLKIEAWPIDTSFNQTSFNKLIDIIKEAGELLDRCGLELSMRNFLMSLFYFAAAYLFVISVWLVLI